MRIAITTSHLFGVGGGAEVVYWLAKSLQRHGDVTVFCRSAVPTMVMQIYLPEGVAIAKEYGGCAAGADLLVNIDHHFYTAPQAKKNWAFIFHPTLQNHIRHGYDLIIATSKYTSESITQEWKVPSTVLYIPIRRGFLNVGSVKRKTILHCSRFTPPYESGDKGHMHMIHAFRSLCQQGVFSDWEFWLAGGVESSAYTESLMSAAQGFPIRFRLNQSQETMERIFHSASIYWHMSGLTDPYNRAAQEHLGLTTIQAMASGAVPIVRPTGGQVEIVKDLTNGLFAMDTKALMEQTAALIGNLSAWATLRLNAIRAAVPWASEEAFNERVDALLVGKTPPDLPNREPATIENPITADDVTAIVPTQDNWPLLMRLIRAMAPASLRTVVVDNGSQQPPPDELGQYPWVKVVRREEPGNFRDAVNSGVEHVTGEWVLLLNDDVAPMQPMWLEPLLQTVNESPEWFHYPVGIVGAKLTTHNGLLQHAGILLDLSRADIGYHRFYMKEDRPAANQLEAMPAVTAACCLVRRDLLPLDGGGGYNYEDVDLCLRAWERGLAVAYDPRSWFLHDEGATKRRIPREKMLEMIKENKRWFLDKWAQKLIAATHADTPGALGRILAVSKEKEKAASLDGV